MHLSFSDDSSYVNLRKIRSWMRSKNVNPRCPACGGTSWAPDDIVSAPVYSLGGIAIGGPTYPMVQLVCHPCM